MATQQPPHATGPSVLIQARPRASDQRRYIRLDLLTISSLFHLRQLEAARILGISLTSLKSACRRLGVERWPYTRDATSPDRTDLFETPARHVTGSEPDVAALGASPSEQGYGLQQASESKIDRGWMDWYLSFPVDDKASSWDGEGFEGNPRKPSWDAHHNDAHDQDVNDPWSIGHVKYS
ncbi:hypothetical protein GUITHDRAFT_117053 [Guillardia theta CCMP2712]|uniref:RWP-RK domain-containing protein n=1 Tax=Guillardia theta (strain CCMP2712) TaxID=905079 RepID=L1ILT1_GUITC|nr:hypothetical protein GUITHDRAFT_117053 [Guillardia theta CCMP2712]EKX36755.1 hypothetical protein GUITHDRAFT_117053 [Guillardia theta CCMP2712]|eukprot:XP_005823735.1 hypothetical protein GUITHDRAFT_117053 [Guillardia theta CCMP2712]